VRRFPDRDLAECGCMYGHSAHLISTLVGADLAPSSRFHIFDYFEGLSEFDAEDQSRFYPDAQSRTEIKKHFAVGEERVAANLSSFPFVRLYKGWIPARFHEVDDRRFSFVSVDVDLYAPTRDALQFFYPRLETGGVIYLDDYGFLNFPGAKQAADELIAEMKPSFFMQLPFGSAFIVK
jgi:O-methyltransferase